MADLIQLRRDKLSVWNDVNPVLGLGEVGLVQVEGLSSTLTNPLQFKVGDGVNSWNNLPLQFASAFNTIKVNGVELTIDVDRTVDIPMPFVSGTGANSAVLAGLNNVASGTGSVAEGNSTIASGSYSHAEGVSTMASGDYSHAEGDGTIAGGDYSHAEGYDTQANNDYAHAEGCYTTASGESSHAEGYGTITSNQYEHAEGVYNKSNTKNDGTADQNKAGTTQMSIGVGTASNARANAFEIMQNGDAYLKGVGGYDGTNATASTSSTLQQVLSNIGCLTETTWSALKSLRDSSGLTPGMQYRITDYNTTTVQSNTQAAGHQFDIIVVADDNHTLNENARAARHAGDTYFSASTLEAWEIKYDIDNDTTKYAWADSGATGRGVIYYMKDEWNNECPYDFKNIQFCRRQTFEAKQYGMTHTYTKNGTVINIDNVDYYGYTRTRTGFGPPPPPEQLYVTETVLQTSMSLYTITDNVATEYTSATVDSVINGTYEAYTFDVLGEDASMSLTKNCYSNAIGKFINNGLQELNWIFFRSTDSSGTFNCYNNVFKLNCRHMTFDYTCYSNAFGNNGHDNTFGNDCYSNTFRNDCEYNTFGNDCNHNTFGNDCRSNTFGNDCSSNTFGNDCGNSTFGNDCSSNTFGNNCDYNTFGFNCNYNTFGNNCSSNTFRNDCNRNTFGNDCNHITFGNDCSFNTFGNNCDYIRVQKDYTDYIIVENGNQYIDITSTASTSISFILRNFTISQGVNNTTTRKTISHTTVNDTFKTTYQPANSQVVNI